MYSSNCYNKSKKIVCVSEGIQARANAVGLLNTDVILNPIDFDFIDSQINWIESQRPDLKNSTILHPILKLPRFVDQILALWDAAAAFPRELCQRMTYDSNSKGYNQQDRFSNEWCCKRREGSLGISC